MNVTSFEDACQRLGITPESVIPFLKPINSTQDALNAVAMLWEIIKAQNGKWVADYKDSNQLKWYPYFRLFSGFAFAASLCDWTSTHAYGGSRFALKSEEDSDYIGKTFAPLYEKVLTIMPIQP